MDDNVIDFNERKKEKEKLDRYTSENFKDFHDFDDFFQYCEIHSKNENSRFSGDQVLTLLEMMGSSDLYNLKVNVRTKTKIFSGDFINFILPCPSIFYLPYNPVMNEMLDEIQKRRDSIVDLDFDKMKGL